MTGAGVFLAGCGLIGALMAATAPRWGERLILGGVAGALLATGFALLAL